MHILITGGAGFIGSHVVRHFLKSYPSYTITNLDSLTYAGNLANLKDVDTLPNYRFVKGDITDVDFIHRLFQDSRFDGVIHLAAESHVDRSIANPTEFVVTNAFQRYSKPVDVSSDWHTNHVSTYRRNLEPHVGAIPPAPRTVSDHPDH